MIRSFLKMRMHLNYEQDHKYTGEQVAELFWVLAHNNLLEFLADIPLSRQMHIRYEDLVREPENIMQKFCGKMDIDYHPEMVEPYQNLDRKMTDGPLPDSQMVGDVKFQDHKKINPKVSESWRKDYSETMLQDITVEVARKLGYSIEKTESVAV